MQFSLKMVWTALGFPPSHSLCHHPDLASCFLVSSAPVNCFLLVLMWFLPTQHRKVLLAPWGTNVWNWEKSLRGKTWFSLCFNHADSLWIKGIFFRGVKQSIFLPVCVTIFLETFSYQVKLNFRGSLTALIMLYAGSHSEARKLKVFAILISMATVR